MDPPKKPCEKESHEVCNNNTSVVTVVVLDNTTGGSTTGSASEWVSSKTITSLESDLRLEGVLANGTDHLKRNVWAIEQTCVIR